MEWKEELQCSGDLGPLIQNDMVTQYERRNTERILRWPACFTFDLRSTFLIYLVLVLVASALQGWVHCKYLGFVSLKDTLSRLIIPGHH